MAKLETMNENLNGKFTDLSSHFTTELSAQVAALNASMEALKAKITADVDAAIKAVKDELTATLEQQTEAAAQPLRSALEKHQQTLDRLEKRTSQLEDLLMRDRYCTIRIVIKKAEATSPATAITFVNTKLSGEGKPSLTAARAFLFTSKGRGGTGPAEERWAVVGKLPTTEDVKELIKRAATLRERASFLTTSYESTKFDRESEAQLRENASFKAAADAHEQQTGKKPFFIFGKARIGNTWWSMEKVAAMEADAAAR